jgi:hypothetical protein
LNINLAQLRLPHYISNANELVRALEDGIESAIVRGGNFQTQGRNLATVLTELFPAHVDYQALHLQPVGQWVHKLKQLLEESVTQLDRLYNQVNAKQAALEKQFADERAARLAAAKKTVASGVTTQEVADRANLPDNIIQFPAQATQPSQPEVQLTSANPQSNGGSGLRGWFSKAWQRVRGRAA